MRREQRVAGRAGEQGGFQGVQPHPRDSALDLVGWGDVSEFAVLGSSIGAGPVVRLIDAAGNRWEVPVSWLDSLPGTIDSAARAWSGGRTGLDVSGLDRPF
jgi:hypothetical protein